MLNLQIKSESFPQRCEVCHQTDCFDPSSNLCSRCRDLQPLYTGRINKRNIHFPVLLKATFMATSETIIGGLIGAAIVFLITVIIIVTDFQPAVRFFRSSSPVDTISESLFILIGGFIGLVMLEGSARTIFRAASDLVIWFSIGALIGAIKVITYDGNINTSNIATGIIAGGIIIVILKRIHILTNRFRRSLSKEKTIRS